MHFHTLNWIYCLIFSTLFRFVFSLFAMKQKFSKRIKINFSIVFCSYDVVILVILLFVCNFWNYIFFSYIFAASATGSIYLCRAIFFCFCFVSSLFLLCHLFLLLIILNLSFYVSHFVEHFHLLQKTVFSTKFSLNLKEVHAKTE